MNEFVGQERETIFALATAPGRAGIAVLRLSGFGSATALESLTNKPLPKPRQAAFRTFTHPITGEVLDQGLALWFPAPKSFTGEDVVELHLHGGRAVVEGVAEALAGMTDLRPAEAGEFSRRAFANGKLDLTQAEGLADLIDSGTAAQRRQALGQMGGSLARLYDGWRERLLHLQATMEATIDFSEEDLPGDLEDSIRLGIESLAEEMATHLDDRRRGETLRQGFHVAIIGPPNAGKSSLLNALVQREAAIVSEIAGTTRDVIEVQMDLGGYPIILADTAGLREGAEAIEAEGIRRAQARAEGADLKLALFDGSKWPDLDVPTGALIDEETIVLVNKTDLCPTPPPYEVLGRPALPLSVLKGEGLEALLKAVEESAAGRFGSETSPALTRVRHRTAVADCVEALERAREAALLELRAEDLRLAARALGRITGRVDVEEILDIVFSEFCIGK